MTFYRRLIIRLGSLLLCNSSPHCGKLIWKLGKMLCLSIVFAVFMMLRKINIVWLVTTASHRFSTWNSFSARVERAKVVWRRPSELTLMFTCNKCLSWIFYGYLRYQKFNGPPSWCRSGRETHQRGDGRRREASESHFYQKNDRKKCHLSLSQPFIMLLH